MFPQKIYHNQALRGLYQMSSQRMCKRCLSITFQLDNINHFKLDPKQPNQKGNIKWNFKQDFLFKTNQHHLKHGSVIIKVTDIKNNQQLGILKINQYLIATGPYHHDYLISLKNIKHARVAFDLTISQIIKVKAEPLQVTLTTSLYCADIFIFTIKTIIGNSTWSSEPSFIIPVGLTHRNSQPSPNNPKQLSPSLHRKLTTQTKDIIWNKSQSLDMPEFKAQFPSEQFSSANLQIIFWVLNQHTKHLQKIYASCSFSFSKLILGKEQIQVINGQNYQVYQVNLEQSLNTVQKYLGQCKLLLLFKVQQHIKQMHVCVRTENGILCSSPIFTDGVSSNQQLTQLVKINQSIQEQFIQLQMLQSQGKSKIVIRKTIQSIIKKLEIELKLLKLSFKQSTIIYRYNSQTQLKHGIEIFLDVIKKMLEFLKQEEEDIRNLCWPVLIAVMNRGQLTLNYMGFNIKQINDIKKKQIDSQLSRKIKFAIRYQDYLYKMLAVALKSLTNKGFQMEQCFAQKFCAYAYFRIPKFRIEVLQQILHKDDPEITQWRGTSYSLSQDLDFGQMKQNSQTFQILFDWGNNFDKVIENEQNSIQNKNRLDEILNQVNWKQRIHKRGGAYCSFIKYLVEYVQELMVKTKDMKWNYFPGYNKIIQSFLVLLKTTLVQKYTKFMKQTAVKLLVNQKLMNIFIFILVEKANLYSSISILKTLDTIMLYFNALKQNSQLIPSNFNQMEFYRALKIIMQSDFAFGIAKTLLLFYYYFDIFSIQFQTTISMFLLGKVFFKYFLHWSNNIRVIFYHFLIFRIYHESSKQQRINQQNIGKLKLNYVLICQQQIKNIKPKYQKLILMIENGQKIRIQQNKKLFFKNYQKQYFKKMKKKITSNRRKNQNNNYNDTNQNSEMKIKDKIQQSNKLQQIPKIINKYCIQQLSKYKLQRYDSQIMKISIIQAMNNRKIQKKNGQLIDNLVNSQQTNVLYQQNQQKKPKKLSAIDIQDFKLIDISPRQKCYLILALEQYLKINQNYLKVLKDKNVQLPKIKIQIPIDQNQFHPEGVDQW